MDEGAIEVADEELGLVGAEADAVGAFEGVGCLMARAIRNTESDTVHCSESHRGGQVLDVVIFGTGVVDVFGVADDDVVGGGILDETFEFAGFEVVGADVDAGGVEGFPVGSEGDAVGFCSVFGKESFFAIGGDFVEFAVGDVGEVEGAIGGDGEAFGPVVADGDELPVFAGDEVFGGAGFAFVEVDGDGRFAVVFPEPGEGFEEDFVAFLAAVAAFIPAVGVFVAGEFESALHRLVGHPPIAAVDVEVIFAILEEDAEGLGFGFADEGGVVISSAEADVGSDHGVNAAEVVRPFPGGGEGGDGTGGSAAEGAVIGVGGELVVFKEGDHFLDEKIGVVGAHAIVFEGAVEAGLGVFISERGGDDAGVDEEADGDGHVAGGDEFVEGIGDVAFFAGIADEAGSVLEDHEGGRLFRVIFCGDVDPVVAVGAGENFGVGELVFGEFSGGEGLGDEGEEEEESHSDS